MSQQLTHKQRGFVAGVASGMSIKDAALKAGYGRGVNVATAKAQASRALKYPKVINALAAAFDKAGATIDASARVVAEAHHAKLSKKKPDHVTRLKAAELNLRARRLLTPREEQASVPAVNIAALVAVVKAEAEKRGLPL